MQREKLLRLGLAALVSGAVLVVVAGPAGFRPREQSAYEAKLRESSTTSSVTSSSSSTTTTTVAPTTTTQAPTTTSAAPATTMPPPPPPTAAPKPKPTATTLPPPATRAPVTQLGLPPTTPPPARDITPYKGLGTWVDAYDFSPQYQPSGQPPTVHLGTIDEMAAVGIKTLYLQAAKDDARSPGPLVNPELLGPMLVKSHALGIKVVAWYLPKFYDLDSDMRRFEAMRDFRFEGHGFDGVGNDIEWRADVPDTAERNRRLIELSRRLRESMGNATLSAIPLPPVVMEVINKNYWPDFPWREIAPYYDVWLPMTYWTFRTQASGYKDGYRYTDENIRRMRNNLGLPDAPVHPVGGTDGKSTDEDYRGFVRACAEQRCVGGSIYDWRTTPPRAYETLRQVPQ